MGLFPPPKKNKYPQIGDPQPVVAPSQPQVPLWGLRPPSSIPPKPHCLGKGLQEPPQTPKNPQRGPQMSRRGGGVRSQCCMRPFIEHYRGEGAGGKGCSG